MHSPRPSQYTLRMQSIIPRHYAVWWHISSFNKLITLMGYVAKYQATNSKKQSVVPHLVNIFQNSMEPEFHHHVHNGPTFDPVLNQTNESNDLRYFLIPIFVLSFHLCSGLTSGLFHSDYTTKALYTSHNPHTCHVLISLFMVLSH
jgi:hypothetical protein